MKKEIIAILIIGLILGIGIVFVFRGLPSKQKPSNTQGEVVNEIVTDNQEKEIDKVQEKQVPEIPKKKVHLEDGVIITSDIKSGGEEIEFIQKVVVDLTWGTGPYQISPPSDWNFESGEYEAYFNVDNNGEIYIHDDHSDIMRVYDNQGIFKREFPIAKMFYGGFEFNQQNEIVFLDIGDQSNGVFYKYSDSGSLINTIPGHSNGYFSGVRFFRDLDGKLFIICAIKDKKTKERNKYVFDTEQDFAQNILQNNQYENSLSINNLEIEEYERIFKGRLIRIVKNKYYYVLKSDALSIYSYDYSEIFTIKLKHPSFLHTDQLFIMYFYFPVVDEEGSIYHIKPNSKGIKVIKWELKQ